MTRRSRPHRWPGALDLALVGVPALVMGVLFLAPLFEILKISVSDPQWGLQNYGRVFTSGSVHQVAMTTLRMCAATTASTLLVGYVLAYILVHASDRAQKILFVCVLIPMWVSVLVRAFAWVVLLRKEGLINSLLISLGVVTSPLELVWNEPGVVLAMTHYMLPYAVLPMYSAMRGIDRRLVAAARGMGASAIQAFTKVFLPLSTPGIFGAGLLVAIFSLGFYVTPVVVGGGRVLMVAEYTSIQITEVLQWGTGAAIATLMVLLICAVLAIAGRYTDVGALFGVGESK